MGGRVGSIESFSSGMVGFDDDLETRTIDEYSANVQDAKREVMTNVLN